MERDTHVVLEDVGDMVFAHIEFPGQAVKRQFLVQMFPDIVCQALIERLLSLGMLLVFLLVYDAVKVQDQIADTQRDPGVFPKAVSPCLFDQAEYLCLYLIEADTVIVKDILPPLSGHTASGTRKPRMSPSSGLNTLR